MVAELSVTLLDIEAIMAVPSKFRGKTLFPTKNSMPS